MNPVQQYFARKRFWINDVLHNNGRMWKAYKEVRYIMQHPEQSRKMREEKLQQLLEFATTHTTFYKQYAGVTDFHNFPVVNKQTYRTHYQDFVVAKEFIPFQEGEVHIQKTSGSTGTPFEIPQDTRCRIRRIATIKAMNELVGFHSFNTLMHTRAFAHYWGGTESIRYDKSLNIVYVDNANLNDTKLQAIADAIRNYKVRYIRGYVTSMEAITLYLVKNNIKIDSRITFITGGELLPLSLKNRIVNQLHCHVTSQYANEENGIFGQSDINGNPTTINLNLANCFVEILKLDKDEPAAPEEMGRVVVTDFTNYAFPMIRYDIGDVAMIDKVAPNGDLLSIKNLSGRSQDMILRTDGSAIDFFNSIPKEVYNNPDIILQWQFTQKDAKKYVLTLCTSDSEAVQESFKQKLISDIKNILGSDAEITINVTTSLPVLNSGKRRVVTNEYKK